jgi:hypothetical protein
MVAYQGTEPRDHTRRTTSMAHTARLASSGEVSSTGVSGPLVFRIAPYIYEIAKTPTGLSYSVTDGNRSLSTPLGWVFGSGHFGQTYLYQQNGTFYESHMSYFSVITAIDFTAGHARTPSPSLEKALADPLDPDTARKCFGCQYNCINRGGTL